MHCNPQGNSNSTGYNLNPTTINNNVFIIYYFHFMYNTKSIYSVQTKNSSTLLSPNDTQLTVSEADTKRSLLGPEFSCLGPKTPSSPAVPFATSVKNKVVIFSLRIDFCLFSYSSILLCCNCRVSGQVVSLTRSKPHFHGTIETHWVTFHLSDTDLKAPEVMEHEL